MAKWEYRLHIHMGDGYQITSKWRIPDPAVLEQDTEDGVRAHAASLVLMTRPLVRADTDEGKCYLVWHDKISRVSVQTREVDGASP